VITGDDVAAAKPAPDTFVLAAQRLDVSPHDSIVIGDSPWGSPRRPAYERSRDWLAMRPATRKRSWKEPVRTASTTIPPIYWPISKNSAFKRVPSDVVAPAFCLPAYCAGSGLLHLLQTLKSREPWPHKDKEKPHDQISRKLPKPPDANALSLICLNPLAPL